MKNWNGERVLILGAARQGLATARHLARHGATVTLNDKRPAASLGSVSHEMQALGVRCVFGDHPLNLLDGTQLVCISGGVPLTLPIVVEAQKRRIPLSNDSQIFMESVPCPVVGITGSAGKTTTTTLVGRIARLAVAAPQKAWVGGNIGNPLIEEVNNIRPDDLVILELSSFQTELMTRSPRVAAILNITPNHLDRHGDMQSYTLAKARLLDFQSTGDVAVLGREDAGAWDLRDRVKGSLISFGFGPLPDGASGAYLAGTSLMVRMHDQEVTVAQREEIKLRGEHNVMNVLAAFAIAAAAGLPFEAMHAALDGFTGVEHRLEYVGSRAGAAWYNDSIATAPERTLAALTSFNEPLVLLLGGRDKNLPYDELVKAIRRRVDHVVVFGEVAGKILEALETTPGERAERPYTVDRCANLESAVKAAAAVAQAGDVVLLSPSATSYDEFTDFAERGEAFRKWVQQLS